ncbi:MAG: TSUP family transporter, partial [Mangrovicoccus sp.]
MDVIFSLLTPAGFAAAAIITVVASFVKGATGFAMPMIMISGMASFLDADLALAMLIIPTLAANLYQALGDGIGAAWGSARLYWRYLTIVLLFIAGSAQLVAILHKSVMFLILGIPITGFAILLLSGVKFVIPPHRRLLADLGIGGFAGFFGGISGVWGPPTVAFLTGIGANKNDSVRIQGVIYGAGAVVLTLSHLRSGVLNAQTI